DGPAFEALGELDGVAAAGGGDGGAERARAAVVVIHDRQGAEQRAALHRVELRQEPPLRGGSLAARRPTRQPEIRYVLLRPGNGRRHDGVLLLAERSDSKSRRPKVCSGRVKCLTTDTRLGGSSSRWNGRRKGISAISVESLHASSAEQHQSVSRRVPIDQ